MTDDPRIAALPDIHGHAKGEHKPFAEERPIPYTARMLFLWFFHACRRGAPRFMMVADHVNYLTFEDPAATNLVRRALKLAQAGDLYGAAETAGVELHHAAAVSEGLRRGMRCSIGAEVDNDPRNRPDAQNIVDAMRPDGMIRAVHFIPITHPQHGDNWMWAFDNAEFKELFDVVGTEQTWEIYVSTLLEALEKLPGHIVAHFYGPAKFGHWPDDAKLEEYEDRLVAACAERALAIEINSRFFYRYFADDEVQRDKYRAVNLRLLRKAKAAGVAIAVGSGAHSPKDQSGAFEAVLALLDEAEINEIAFPIAGRLAHVALRATEEHARQLSGYAVEPPPSVPIEVVPEVSEVAATGPSEQPNDGVPQRPRPRRPARVKRPAAAAAPAEPTQPLAASEPTPAALPPSREPAAVAPRRRTRPQSARTLPTAAKRPAPVRDVPKPKAKKAGAVKACAPQAKPAHTKTTTAKRARPSRKSTSPKRTSPSRATGSSTKKVSASKKTGSKRSGSSSPRKASARKTTTKPSPTRKLQPKVTKRPASVKQSATSKKTPAKKSAGKKKSSRSRR